MENGKTMGLVILEMKDKKFYMVQFKLILIKTLVNAIKGSTSTICLRLYICFSLIFCKFWDV